MNEYTQKGMLFKFFFSCCLSFPKKNVKLFCTLMRARGGPKWRHYSLSTLTHSLPDFPSPGPRPIEFRH